VYYNTTPLVSGNSIVIPFEQTLLNPVVLISFSERVLAYVSNVTATTFTVKITDATSFTGATYWIAVSSNNS
jgi:hypothetical protein